MQVRCHSVLKSHSAAFCRTRPSCPSFYLISFLGQVAFIDSLFFQVMALLFLPDSMRNIPEAGAVPSVDRECLGVR